jgi:hypothetical protein
MLETDTTKNHISSHVCEDTLTVFIYDMKIWRYYLTYIKVQNSSITSITYAHYPRNEHKWEKTGTKGAPVSVFRFRRDQSTDSNLSIVDFELLRFERLVDTDSINLTDQQVTPIINKFCVHLANFSYIRYHLAMLAMLAMRMSWSD